MAVKVPMPIISASIIPNERPKAIKRRFPQFLFSFAKDALLKAIISVVIPLVAKKAESIKPTESKPLF